MNSRHRRTTKLLNCAFIWGIAGCSAACSDDADGPPNTFDASTDDTTVVEAGLSDGAAHPSTTDSAPALDAGAVADASLEDGGSLPGQLDASDATERDDAGLDAASVDAATDSSAPGPQVFVPEGGVVLRPVEAEFTSDRLAQLNVPDGFEINVFAAPTGQTRMLAEHLGATYVTRPTQGDVVRLADTDADGVADVESTALSGLDMVHGIVFYGDDVVYLATPKQVIRATVAEDGSFSGSEILINDLPDGGQHPLRTLGVGPDSLLYISVGSSCDACVETNPEHATMLQASLDGVSRAVFASGLRNTIGFGWHPVTAALWGMDNGSDWRGNELPPEELNLITQGANYGWPYCYGMQELDPIIADPPDQTKAEFCATTTPSVLTNQAHEAPIGMVFYDATAFPAEYQGDAFIAMRGSWNRIPATGYKIVRIDFDAAGQPTGIEDFVSGFLNDEGLETFARPAGVTVSADGSLLFADDTNGIIYRVSVEP